MEGPAKHDDLSARRRYKQLYIVGIGAGIPFLIGISVPYHRWVLTVYSSPQYLPIHQYSGPR
jgi:hypothetical protein